MDFKSAKDYIKALEECISPKCPYDSGRTLLTSLTTFINLAYKTELQNNYSKPMLWIGIYIALASLFCVLAMVADLLHGLRNKKLYFPCKYFTINAASLTVIAVAMKLPVDLTNPMPGHVDQMAKLGSMAFMCTMMANLLPSLATMDNKELFTNVIALVVLVITLVVNLCIQIQTGVISYDVTFNIHGADSLNYFELKPQHNELDRYRMTTAIYVTMLLILLIIHVCSSLVILKSKQMIESKYQDIALKDQQPKRLTVEKLKQHVRNYWMMAETGSPQFMTVCFATTSASGVICTLSTILHILNVLCSIQQLLHIDFGSDYKWSTLAILIIQSIGVILGTIAPLCRCFATLNFKVSIKTIWNHIKVFKVESYWTQKLSDWKRSSISFSFRSHICKVVIENLKKLILSFCIGIQKAVVVACKMISLIPYLFMICALYCFKWLRAMLSESGIVLGKTTQKLEQDNDIRIYVLHLQDEMEFSERTLKGLSKSMNRLIEKSEKQEPKKLMKLLEESRGFEGVEKFESQHVPPLLPEEHLNCWSLPLVTLTTIAISLPNIQDNILDNLLSSVSEGLAYVKHVEESFNATDEYVSIQKESKALWLELEVSHKWLGNKVKPPALQANTTRQILEWFRDTAKKMVTGVLGMNIEDSNENSFGTSICANSMYRITQTILISYQDNIEEVSQKKLLAQLTSMIADILAACLTNLPQVITRKCNESAIEKREASVHAAAQLLGETTQIINSLHKRPLPRLNPDEFPFIDNWRAYLKHHFP